MKRRDFLRCAGLASAGLTLPGASRAFAKAATAGGWRTFEVTMNVEVVRPAGTTRVWVPAPLAVATPYQKPAGPVIFRADGGTAAMATDARSEATMVAAEWREGVRPVLAVTSRVSTRNHAVDVTKPAHAPAIDRASLARYLRPTALLPTDGIVKTTANEITRDAGNDVEKARAIYEWIIDNTFRDPKTRGCGLGDIRFMLESKALGGKCADLNALYVGLARAAALPARDVYGLRLAKSDLGYASLGAATENVTKSQHCRAEVYLTGYGWVPVDPADVRKVVLEEPPGKLALSDGPVSKARARLFGSWEMN